MNSSTTHLRRRIGVISIALAGVVAFATSGDASAHTPNVVATCSNLTVKLSSYQAPADNNLVTVTINGVTTQIYFGNSFSQVFTFADTTIAHTWSVDIDANRKQTDNQTKYDRHFEGSQEACTGGSTTTSTTTSTTPPSSSSSTTTSTTPPSSSSTTTSTTPPTELTTTTTAPGETTTAPAATTTTVAETTTSAVGSGGPTPPVVTTTTAVASEGPVPAAPLPGAPAAPSPVAPAGGSSLPTTGSDTGESVLIALTALLGGSGLVALSRRKASR